MNKKELETQHQVYLEKALQFYLFSGQREITKLPDTLQKRFRGNRQVAYSLIKTFIAEGDFKPEYMQYLNDELNELRRISPNSLKQLLITPFRIHEIELSERLQISFNDEETGEWQLRYNRSKQVLFHNLEQ